MLRTFGDDDIFGFLSDTSCSRCRAEALPWPEKGGDETVGTASLSPRRKDAADDDGDVNDDDDDDVDEDDDHGGDRACVGSSHYSDVARDGRV